MPGGALTVTPGVYDPLAQSLTDIADGDSIDLVRPPQGGYVVFVGARVRGETERSVEIAATLTDAAAMETDRRTVTMQPSPTDPTIYQPDLRSFVGVANITMCPSTATVDRDDVPMTLTVRVTESTSRRFGETTRRVTPSCRQTDAHERSICQCMCQTGFSIGKCP
jgi:hypothetical protein